MSEHSGVDAMPRLLRYHGAVEQDPEIDRWFARQPSSLATIGQFWFDVFRHCGSNVRELMHDGYATVCVQDVPFGYVGVFKSHVNVGFFQGATLPDPARLLEGTGKFMRHVKLKPARPVDETALKALVECAYRDIIRKIEICK